MIRQTRIRAASLGLLVTLAVACAWPWPWMAQAFSTIYSPVVNLFITNERFGRGGHAQLITMRQTIREPTDNVTADTAISFTVAGFRGDLRSGISLRRDAYLPLLLVIGLIVAAPLPVANRLMLISIAIPFMTALNVVGLHLLIVWTFSVRMTGVYDMSDRAKRLIDFANGALLTPPGNRFIAPVGVAAALLAWQFRTIRKRSNAQPIGDDHEGSIVGT